MTKSVAEDLVRVKPNNDKQSVHLSLPVPPSVNSIYYNVRGGGRRLTALAQNYIRDSRAIARQAISDSDWRMTPKHEWLYCDMVFYFPDRRVRDAHNCLKILMDVLEGIVYENDYTVLPRIQSVEYDKGNPRVEIVFSHQTDKHRRKGIKQTT